MEAKIEDQLLFFGSSYLSPFLKKATEKAKQILAHEMHLTVQRCRFSHNRFSYPLKIILFDHPKTLGFFDPHTFEIGLNKACFFAKEQSWSDVLRHELAHYITFIEFGTQSSPHGSCFQSVVKRFGWTSDIAKSQGTLAPDPTKKKSRSLYLKIEKLANLSTSHHPEEAKAALNKMQALMEKYHLEERPAYMDEDSHGCMVRVLAFKKVNAKIKAIQEILRHFFVAPILNKGNQGGYLEVIGMRSDCEIAHFIAHFLKNKLEDLWLHAKKKDPSLKGLAHKNAFFFGISKGYLEQKKAPPLEQSKNLILLEKKIHLMVHDFYPHLTPVKTRRLASLHAFKQGKKAGRNLKIAQAIKESKLGLYLTFKGIGS